MMLPLRSTNPCVGVGEAGLRLIQDKSYLIVINIFLLFMSSDAVYLEQHFFFIIILFQHNTNVQRVEIIK